jgi:hypothetical protein
VEAALLSGLDAWVVHKAPSCVQCLVSCFPLLSLFAQQRSLCFDHSAYLLFPCQGHFHNGSDPFPDHL